jgi:hypothetical protein
MRNPKPPPGSSIVVVCRETNMSDYHFGSPLDIPEEIREALYCYEVLRTVGVPAAFIFAMKLDGGIGMIVRWRDVEIAVAGYRTSMTNDEFERDWPAAVALWNETCNTDSRWALLESETRQNAVSILSPLMLAFGDLSEMVEPS